MGAWLASFLAELVAKLAPILIGLIDRLRRQKAAEAQQNEVVDAIQKGDTLAAEKALNSDVAGTPSGLPGTGIRPKTPVNDQE